MVAHPYADAPPALQWIAERHGAAGCTWYLRVWHGPFLEAFRENFTRNSFHVHERDEDVIFFLKGQPK